MKIVVFGGNGMLGKALAKKLRLEDLDNEVFCPQSKNVNLLSYAQTATYLNDIKPDAVYNCAGKVGGIVENTNNQYQFLIQNAQIAINVVDACVRADVKSYYYIASSCCYPDRESVQGSLFVPSKRGMEPNYLMSGRLERTNEGYGMAKLLGIHTIKHINDEDKDYRAFIPCNLYGPGDNFSESGHVLAGLIKRTYEAYANANPYITNWGSGEPYRQFLHVDDCASGIIIGVNRLYDPTKKQKIINVGDDEEHRIMDLAHNISVIIQRHFNDTIFRRPTWDKTKPDGITSKFIDSTPLYNVGWKPRIDLIDGIKGMIHEYETYRREGPAPAYNLQKF